MQTLKERTLKFIRKHRKEYEEIALAIHKQPEVSNYEFFASKTLLEKLKAEGFETEYPAAHQRTGFAASYKASKEGPVIVYLAEYDALTGLGHGCGHNLFGAASICSAIALKEVIEEIGGEIRVYGTPGEEGGEEGSAKASFVRDGYFKDADVALCVHPGSTPLNTLTMKTLANAPVDIEFWGRSAHAASHPHLGLNALDAQIMTYNAISVLRQQLTDDARLHGVITDGGTAPNIIPDYTRSRWYLRAASKPVLNDIYERVEKIVEGSALQTGTKGKMHLFQNFVDNTVLTPSLDAVYAKNLEALGFPCEKQSDAVWLASSDVGNVSQVIPVIQPFISITDQEIASHSPDMVNASKSKKGLDFIETAAAAMAHTAIDLILDPKLLEKIKEEHHYNVTHQ